MFNISNFIKDIVLFFSYENHKDPYEIGDHYKNFKHYEKYRNVISEHFK